MSHRSLVWFATLGLSACSLFKGPGDSKPFVAVPMPSPLYGSPLGLVGDLNEFESCTELEGWLREETLKRTAHELEWEKYYYFHASDGMVVEDAAAGAESSSGRQQTSTNNQVANVDENDRVKHVGDRIYALGPNALHVVKSWPANTMALEGSLRFPDPVESMLLIGARAVIFGSTHSFGLSGRAMPTEPGCLGCYGGSTASVRLVDVSTPTPTLVQTQTKRASLRAARQIGAKVRYVMQAELAYPTGFQPHASLWQRQPETPEDVDRFIAEVMATNSSLLATWTLADWTDYGVKLAENDCRSVYRPSAHSELAFTTVTTLDPATGSEQVTAILSRASEVYASNVNLYIANQYWGGHESGFAPHTFVHKFSLNENDSRYVGSGGVEGAILNQFSLDEKDDHLRVAVTALNGEGRARTSINRVVTLAQEGASLVIKGQTPDLAPGERIYSVRFDGDKGYVVTFRQIDPLYVLDLSDAAAPRVTGELKIPGFSSYLHKLSETRLLGVGQQDGFMKLSLFDIADPSAPAELDALLVDGWSNVANDHRGFSYAPWLSTFVLTFSPAMSMDYGLSSFSVVNDTIVKGRYFPAQRMANGSLVGFQNGRSVFRDNILYTVTGSNVAAFDLTQQGGSLLQSVAFP